jgi:hypothetical protein
MESYYNISRGKQLVEIVVKGLQLEKEAFGECLKEQLYQCLELHGIKDLRFGKGEERMKITMNKEIEYLNDTELIRFNMEFRDLKKQLANLVNHPYFEFDDISVQDEYIIDMFNECKCITDMDMQIWNSLIISEMIGRYTVDIKEILRCQS